MRTANAHGPLALQDATSSIDVLRALSRLSGCGMNVITVIHQPRYSLYELFDSLLLLGVGGVTVYNGPPLLTERYFGMHGFAMQPHDNVADFNLDVVSGRMSKAGDPLFKKESLPCVLPLRACLLRGCSSRASLAAAVAWCEMPMHAGDSGRFTGSSSSTQTPCSTTRRGVNPSSCRQRYGAGCLTSLRLRTGTTQARWMPWSSVSCSASSASLSHQRCVPLGAIRRLTDLIHGLLCME